MADIRFKISGNTPTFLAGLYSNASFTCLLQQQEVNYSGITVIFGELLPSTCYYVSVYDSIGNRATGSTITSSCSVGTTTLATKCVYLGGTVCSDPLYPYTSYVNSVGSRCNNQIMISPALSQGESVNVILTVLTQNNTGGVCNNNCSET